MNGSVNSFLSRIEQRKLVFWGCMGLVALIQILLFSFSTSILNPHYWVDSSIFMEIGRGMSRGLVPYRDLFDHKGPLLFLINAIGFWIYDGKLGVMLVQTIFMTVSLAALYKIARLYVKPTLAAVVIGLFIFLFIGVGEGGNLTEEWSLPFTLVPVYLVLKYFRKDNAVIDHPFRYSFIYGICLGAHIMIRVNNAAILCGMVLCFAILFIKEKAIGKLLIHAILVLLGASVVIVPFVIYFVVNQSFSEFIYASFIHNFFYAMSGASEKTVFDWLRVCFRISSLIPLIWVALKCKRLNLIDANSCYLTISMGVVSALVMFIGFGWLHYSLVYVPIMLVGVSYAFMYFGKYPLKIELRGNREKSRATVSYVLVIAFVIMPFLWGITKYAGYTFLVDVTGYCDDNLNSVQEIVSKIPEDERDSVLAYDVTPEFYMYADIIPSYKYFMLQSFQSQGNESMRQEIKNMLDEKPPRWVVINRNTELENEELRMNLDSEYELMAEVDYGLNVCLYQRMESLK